jgi:hypothetical protein
VTCGLSQEEMPSMLGRGQQQRLKHATVATVVVGMRMSGFQSELAPANAGCDPIRESPDS